jgi:hypothetical protein
MTEPYKFINNTNSSLARIESSSKKLMDSLTINSQNPNNIGSIPFYSTGARSFIRIGGKPVGVAQSIQWSVKYLTTPINTIDSPFAWDFDVGQAVISASLSQIMDPTAGPEANNLFAIMSSAVHQPLVEIQVLDASGTSLFWAKGMFVGVSGNVARGALSTLSSDFLGLGYQHYVSQGGFKPYDGTGSSLQGFANNLKSLVGGLSGGIL